jgi:hypothetical protein
VSELELRRQLSREASLRRDLDRQIRNVSSGGAGGGGDAPTLQGHPASYFATADHSHAASYAPLQIPGPYTTAGRPDPATRQRQAIVVQDAADQPSHLEVSLPNSAGGWEWIVTSLLSS